jgi:hypothetical protein
MYASVRQPFVIDSAWFRWLARASAAVLVLTWVVFVLAEGVRARFEEPATDSHSFFESPWLQARKEKAPGRSWGQCYGYRIWINGLRSAVVRSRLTV